MSNIVGPLGFRVIRWGVDGQFHSPAYSADWTPDGILTAQCPSCKNVPGENCTCGIYVTIDVEYALTYFLKNTYVLTLVEGTGKVIEYTHGFRAEEAVVLQVLYPRRRFVPEDNSLLTMMAYAARDYFKKDKVFTIEAAELAVRLQWEKVGNRWPWPERAKKERG